MIVMVFEIDQDLYDKVTAILAPQGLTLSDAIVLLFKKTAELGRPASPLHSDNTRKRYPRRHRSQRPPPIR